MKIVVFDLDETLGYFVEFGIFWDCLNQFLAESHQDQISLNQTEFNHLLELYPEFLRPNIITILKYLMHKKKSKCCHKMLIYTNNQGPKSWSHYLMKFFEDKLNYELFDQIICAFKINGQVIEVCRSSHDKSYRDLVKCTRIPANSQICFLDDNYYPEMANDNVYYINVKPYVHDLTLEEMIERFWNSTLREKLITTEYSLEDFEKKINQWWKLYDYMVIPKLKEEYNIDKILSKKILIHLEEFFDYSFQKKARKTLKREKDSQGKTKKRR